jgi:hypothetical protein
MLIETPLGSFVLLELDEAKRFLLPAEVAAEMANVDIFAPDQASAQGLRAFLDDRKLAYRLSPCVCRLADRPVRFQFETTTPHLDPQTYAYLAAH